MKKPANLKKVLILNIPYVLFALLGTKCGQAVRLAPGADFSGKALHILDGFQSAFASIFPSFHPADLLVGVVIAAIIRLVVYVKAAPAGVPVRTSLPTSTLCRITTSSSPRRKA